MIAIEPGNECTTLAPPAAHRGKFGSLDAGRGIAALFVLVAHAGSIIAEPRFYNLEIWNGRLGKFGAGVDFFFVLSGFIIAWSHYGDIGHPNRLANYAGRRFRRIYPSYWAVLLPLSAFYFIFPKSGNGEQRLSANFFYSFTLFPHPLHPILGVAWTLVYEIIFYCIFGLVIWAGKSALAFLGFWAALILACSLITEAPQFPLSILLDSLNLEFLMGVAAAFYLKRHQIPSPALMAISGFSIFLGIILINYPVEANPVLMRTGYGLSITMAILGLVEIERSKKLDIPQVLQKLGSASYAIYLVHGIAISIAIHVVVRLPHHDGLPLPVVLMILIAAGLMAGLMFHEWVEAPLTQWLKPKSRNSIGNDNAG